VDIGFEPAGTKPALVTSVDHGCSGVRRSGGSTERVRFGRLDTRHPVGRYRPGHVSGRRSTLCGSGGPALHETVLMMVRRLASSLSVIPVGWITVYHESTYSLVYLWP
jgi:hypothetical protein